MKYVIANWKMNFGLKDVVNWISNFNLDHSQNVEVVIAPSFIHIPILFAQKEEKHFKVSAQNVSLKNKGTYTGEIGIFQVKDLCDYCIIGHSETGDNISTIIQKVDFCLSHKVTPIVCFKYPDEAKILKKDGVILVWEDPSNISKDGIYKDKNIKEIISGVAHIRRQIGNDVHLLYGGSVNGQNAPKMVNITGLDGVLIGNYSLDPTKSSEVIKIYEN